MYEAKQRKERVSRRIEESRMTREGEKSLDKQKSIHFVSLTNRNILMRHAIGPSSFQEITGPSGQKANICTSNTVRLDSFDSLDQLYKDIGSQPQWPAEWAGWLIDKSTGNNATQCHVINQNFGGSGKHLDHNLHPGSHTLNDNHKYQMENIVKKAFQEDVKGQENVYLEFTCNFQPSFITNVPLYMGQDIGDPTITGFYSIHNSSGQQKGSLPTVSKGQGMYVPNYTYSHRKRKNCLWTSEEDKKLQDAIHKFGNKDWASIANTIPGRTRVQCCQRWERTLNPAISREPWKAEEDKKLEECVKKNGEHLWRKTACELGNRSDVQCRYRWQSLKKIQKQLQNHESEPQKVSLLM